MLLAIDVGNTNITIGVFKGRELKATFRITSKAPKTSDEYGAALCNLLEYNNIPPQKIADVIVASVVPNVMYSLVSAVIKYFGIHPVIVEAGIKTGIRVAIENPRQLGADRIVDAVAAYEIYGGPVLVIDYGTATTYDLVDESGAFIAGVTAPGIQTSAQALFSTAAKLPEVEIVRPKTILAQETISSMQAGIFFGQLGQTEYIIKNMKKESQLENIKTVATGGLGVIIAKETDLIDVYDPMLTLYGMQRIQEKQTRRPKSKS